jgi:hypothetical protein
MHGGGQLLSSHYGLLRISECLEGMLKQDIYMRMRMSEGELIFTQPWEVCRRGARASIHIGLIELHS